MPFKRLPSNSCRAFDTGVVRRFTGAAVRSAAAEAASVILVIDGDIWCRTPPPVLAHTADLRVFRRAGGTVHRADKPDMAQINVDPHGGVAGGE